MLALADPLILAAIVAAILLAPLVAEDLFRAFVTNVARVTGILLDW